MARFPKSFSPALAVALLITALAVELHIYFLFHAGGFWRDEVNLLNLARSSSLNAMSHDSFPVLMPLLVRTWEKIGIGKTEIGLRLLGALIGLALVAVLWIIAWKFRRLPPLPGLMLLALNGTVIVFGDSLRAYGLGSLLILLTFAAAWWFLENPSWLRAIGWAVPAILSVQTLFQNAIFIAAICGGTWAICARNKWCRPALKVLAVAVLAAISLLPYYNRIISLPAAASSLRIGAKPVWLESTFDTAVGSPAEQCRWLWFLFSSAIVALGCVNFFPRSKSRRASLIVIPIKYHRWTILLIALATAAAFLWFAAAPVSRWWFFPLLILAVIILDWNFVTDAATNLDRNALTESNNGLTIDDLTLFAGTTLFLAVAGFAGFLWYAALPTQPWYFITLMVLVAGCFEFGLPARGHARAAIVGFSLVTTALALAAFFPARQIVNWRFTNLDIVAPRIAAEAGPDDFVIVSPWFCGLTFGHYFTGITRWDTVPPLKDHSVHRYDLVHAQMQNPSALQPLIEQVVATLRSGHRVWLIGETTIPVAGTPAPPDLPPPPLPYSGWSDQPYMQNWTQQLDQFLSDHSREFKKVYETPAANLNFMENLPVYCVQGWRN